MLSKLQYQNWSRKGVLRFHAALYYASLFLITAVILSPIIIAFSSAFKFEADIYAVPFRLIPEVPTLDNFRQLLDRFPLYIYNSFKVTGIIVLLQIVTATTAGYCFSKLEWKGRDFIFILYIASIMIPGQAVIIPQFIIVQRLGLYNTHAGLIFVSVFTAFGTFLVKQFFMTIPESFIEAARIDGASEIFIFRKVMIPLSKTVIATLVIFSFRFFWNDFFGPLIYLASPNLKTLPLGMADFANEHYTYVGPQMAATIISIIPVLLVFLAGQKHFVKGTMSAGIKG
ncbi:carbohydrate ABC transporter membrane protein 2, CUT1 family [Alkalispirochaeta americana]|uniref:Carbohydrate ABC transporter membrane protein 2, CUT1 family n=2 Tax=Alkalispirochaeta americana TaxID=159291 RepID=A0A1N6XLZ2_9SPIO|nr:carbohydrate ABC transporter membrane protein 2, CUT1 family [Alkalispirochaeta americana]